MFVCISVTSNSQVDYSIFLQKKISKKDMKVFTNLSNFKKHQYSKCLKGNCKNGISLLKQSFLKSKKNSFKVTHTFLIEGMFKNGKLNGEATIFYYTHFYYNEKAKYNGVFSNNRDILTDTDFVEYVKGNFKNNVITKGEYVVKVRNIDNKTVLMNLKENPDFRTYFSDWEIHHPKNKFNDQCLISYKYNGNFESLSAINGKLFEKLELLYKVHPFPKNDYCEITIKPNKEVNTYSFTQKIKSSYKKTIYTKPKLFSIINNECDGCWFGDMTLDEHRQYVINKKQKIIKQIEYLKQQKLAKKVNRAKSFVGHYIIGEKNGVIVFVKGYYEESGCLYTQRFPYSYKPQYDFYDNCNHENYKIIDHIAVCPNCRGFGTESVKVITNLYDYHTDSSGNKIYSKRPDRIMTNYEDHVCHVCNGDGLISTQN